MSKIINRVLSFFMTLLISLSGINADYEAPSTNQQIKPSNNATVRMSFIAWADPQISNYITERFSVFKAAAADLKNSDGSIDALVIAGDIAENGLQCEYDFISENIAGADVGSYIMAVGNHDVRMRRYSRTVARFTDFTNSLNSGISCPLVIDKLSYAYRVNGYKFIVLGTDRTEFEESWFGKAQLEWLDGQLSEENGKPVFVICHQSLKDTHGLPDTWNSPFDWAGSVGNQSEQLEALMSEYKNVFYITGHLHTGFGQYSYETRSGINLINLPSLCIDNKDGTVNGSGLGYVVEVSRSSVLFRARNFEKGEWKSDCDIKIKVK